MKRKLIGLMCVLAITSSFIACGGDKKDDSSGKTEVSEESGDEGEEEKKDKKDKKDENESEENKGKESEADEENEKVSSDNVLADYGLGIEIPSKWTKLPESFVEAAGGGSVSANILGMWSVELTTGATFGIATEGGAAGITLSKYKDAMKVVLEGAGKEVKANDKKCGDVDAIELKYSETQNGIEFEVTQVMMISGDDVIMIMLSEPTDKDSNIDKFEEVLESIEEL